MDSKLNDSLGKDSLEIVKLFHGNFFDTHCISLVLVPSSRKTIYRR